ncbi:hypothetical protein KKI17_02290 [Patescibacteria group bacterium]|nr:hypothetical protein [Patescibacteria group bacterium]
MDRRLGVDQPPGYPFSLNAAVDTLLKKEFDTLRRKQEPHPLFPQYGIDAVPFQHPKMNEWRETMKGLQYSHEPSGFLVTGAVDDIWQNSKGELHVVDYKATSKNGEVNLDADWQRSREHGVTAVPTFSMGGRNLVGAQSYAVLEKFVQEGNTEKHL